MRSVKLGWLICLLTLSMCIWTGHYFYSQQAVRFERHAANVREIKRLKEQQAKMMVIPDTTKEEQEVLKLLAARKGDLWFLEDIEERLGAKIVPTFLMIGPMKREEKKNHIRFSRQVSLEASFPELIGLLDILEKKRGFTVNNLKVTVDPDEQKRHRMNFLLSCIKIKESFMSQLGVKDSPARREDPMIASLLLDAPWQPGKKLVLSDELTDPFVKVVRQKPKKKKKKIYRRVRKVQKPKALVPINLAGKYTLQGIVAVAGKQMVLIAPDHVLQKGDLLDEKQLISIEREKIIFQKGKQKYFLKLPGTVDLKSKNALEQNEALYKKTKDKGTNRYAEANKISVAAVQGESRVTTK